MPIKSNWEVNDYCEFKNPKDNKWYEAIIKNINSELQTFNIIIISIKEEWKIAIISQNIYIIQLYNAQIH